MTSSNQLRTMTMTDTRYLAMVLLLLDHPLKSAPGLLTVVILPLGPVNCEQLQLQDVQQLYFDRIITLAYLIENTDGLQTEVTNGLHTDVSSIVEHGFIGCIWLLIMPRARYFTVHLSCLLIVISISFAHPYSS